MELFWFRVNVKFPEGLFFAHPLRIQ